MKLYMPLFRSCSTLRTLSQLHTHFLVTSLHRDTLASTKLIESYAQMGSLESARLIFQSFPTPDSFMWGVLIKCYVWNSFFKEAILLYQEMLSKQTEMSSFIFPSILRACSGIGDLGFGEKVHGRIIECGFDSDFVIETSLLRMYGDMGCLDSARKVFDEMSIRDVVSWSSIISSYVQNGQASEGLEIFRKMVFEGIKPDSVMMLSVTEACAELSFLRLARSVQGYISRQDIESDGSLDNSLIVMYSKCSDLYSAERLFMNGAYWNVASWTAMMSCYNQSCCFKEALAIFVEMLKAKVEPNFVTMMGVLGSCSGLGWLKEGKSAHCFVVRKALDSNFDFLGPALIEFYADCGKVGDCEKIFDAIQERSIVSWNVLIALYARKGLSKEGLICFDKMQKQGILPDSFTYVSVLSACGNLGFSLLGHHIHACIIKTGCSNEFTKNALIDMYSKCGFLYSAYKIFDKTQQRSVITWNSMICGFSQNGYSVDAISLFDQMYFNSLEMNKVTFLSVIQACSQLGYLEKGKWVHHKLITYGVKKDTYIDTALTDMYAKCGDFQMAQGVFDSISERSIVSWSAMIAGYGMHGHINAAISLFTQMIESGIKPNEVTFMNILSACSHSGSVEEGKFYFNLMTKFDIEPNSEHFACMVDLLSRAGDLNGAYRIINSMPFPADASIWGALLNGCRIHRRMDMIRSIQRNLLDIDTDDAGHYALLSNMYAEGGNWDLSRKVRSTMKSIGLRKVPGYSTVEISKRIYRFGAGDASHLEDFQHLAQEQGYNVESDSSMSDICEFSEGNICYESQREAGNCIWNNQYQSRNDTLHFKKP